MISFIVPTIGRSSLADTLNSIECQGGDEVIVVGIAERALLKSFPRVRYISCEPGHDWGCKERRIGIADSCERYLAFIDDDDVYTPGSHRLLNSAMHETPGRPVLFRMQYPSGRALWEDPELRCGNVSSQMIFIPNVPSRLGKWTSRREGDFDFLASMKWAVDEIVWRPEVLAKLGHDDA